MTIINQFIFICLFAGCFFVPGWLVCKALGFRRHRFLLSLSLSYAWLILALTVLQFVKMPVSFFAPFILGGAIVSGALWLARCIGMRLCHGGLNRSARSCSGRSKTGSRFRPGILVPFIAVMGLLWAYLWWAGPYLEIPSDAWNHVWAFRNAQTQINTGNFGNTDASFFRLLTRQGNAWYLIIACLMHWSGASIPRVLAPLTFVTVSTFCAGIFFCALAIFRPFRFSIRQKGWMAAGATLFCAATMGTSVFAYIRYYALAPTVLNYLIFLGATLVALDWFNSHKWWTNAAWLIPAMIATMNLVHSQEVLFTGFMIMGLALVNIAHRLIGAKNPVKETLSSVLVAKSLVVAGIALSAWLAIFFWLKHANPIIWPTANTIMPNMPFHAGQSAPLVFKALIITPPSHPIARLFVYQFYMFYQTIGCWGFFVYIAFLLGFRQMAKSNYLLAGMISPLLTIFNPVTIDLFVRLVTTLQAPGMPPVTIWRFGYMLPLPFVAALAMGSAIKTLRWRAARRGAAAFRKPSNAALIKAAVIVMGLIGLILPVQNRWIDAPFSRLYTLSKHFGNDTSRWKDLTDFVSGLPKPMLVTDPNTCLIFYHLYPEHPSFGLQWMASNDPEPQFLEAIKRQPELVTRGIIIINRRDGAPSVTGRISGHWPEDAFLTSHFYSPKAIAFVESQTNRFKLLWAKDRIKVFEITP